METSQLKSYAPKARRKFIDAVTAQAARFGVTATGVDEATVQGDVMLIGGRAHPAPLASARAALVARVEAEGFEHAIESIAYTWFNRLAAIRYMELHGYLGHGFRVLSHPTGTGRPEILERAADIDLPDLDREKAIELKLDGTKDEELYRLLLLAQCNALHQAMPFLFEKVGGETELLLPANLLHTDSLIRQMVESIDEELWQDIEIIGWLYQFYISEKKDEVIGKVVKSEDIPAATQLFTPNWIVKYMVQNSLGAQWLATYPQSPLKGVMEYYIEPAEQAEEVNAQLAAMTPKSLDPEELTLIDPACGSGHILVEAYELFKAIYLERGYRRREIPQLILEKNLFGLDIDERAAQLTGFALMMKGRADDRRLFERGVKLNVMALVDSAGFDAEALARGVDLAEYGLEAEDLKRLKLLFEHATTIGSLIQVPEVLTDKLTSLSRLSKASSQHLFVSAAILRLGRLVKQADIVASRYDAVVANPPYMGKGGMNGLTRTFVKSMYPRAKADLSTCFVERGYALARSCGRLALVTMHGWMFLSSYERMRRELLRSRSIQTLAHLGARAFAAISGEIVQTTAFVLFNGAQRGHRPTFFRLVDGEEDCKRRALAAGAGRFDQSPQSDFEGLPGSPVAYWLSGAMRRAFLDFPPLSDVASPKQGLATTNNDKFLRYWWEPRLGSCKFDADDGQAAARSGARWFPCQKGGAFRKWFGNNEHVVDWGDSGAAIKRVVTERYGSASKRVANEGLYFREGATWSCVSGASMAMRYVPSGFIFETSGSMCFFSGREQLMVGLAFLNSAVVDPMLQALSPTLSLKEGPVGRLPLAVVSSESCAAAAEEAVALAQADWASFERSWDFRSPPLLGTGADRSSLIELSYEEWLEENLSAVADMRRSAEAMNRLFIDAYALADELAPDVPIDQITLTVNPAYRYGGKLAKDEQRIRFRQDTMGELVSYAVGCMMGRYSLDDPGLIYAHGANEGFEPGRYTSLPADDDGIVPLTDTEWFDDDAARRVVDFVLAVWGEAHLEHNLTFLADNLHPKQGESSRATLRRYLCDKFFKVHLKTYRNRPIYWLFSSGKAKAFQCLVYLHRYNEGTLSRMRSEYVIPLQGKMASRLEQLDADVEAATSTAHRRRVEKERERLQKQQVELRQFDEKLRHYADRRIALDLDDGVKVNYGKFGDLLAEVKAVHGKPARGV